MARQLKRWESPRREGRNSKGKGGSARQRQRRKQFQVLRQKLKEESKDQKHERGSINASPFIFIGQLYWATASNPDRTPIPKVNQKISSLISASPMRMSKRRTS